MNYSKCQALFSQMPYTAQTSMFSDADILTKNV